MEFANLFPTHFFILDPGLVAMKARITVTLLANTEDKATEKTIPKAVCRRRQVTFPGLPMKRKEKRKQKRSEMRRM